MERDLFYMINQRKISHFNSHAHVERDENRLSTPFDVNISTHTLTWSVTPLCNGVSGVCEISTHTLTWSVTSV